MNFPHGGQPMSTSSNQDPAGGNMTRKQRRAAERAARKSSGGKAPSSASGGSSGPSMLVISIGAIIIGAIAVAALILVSGGLGEDNGEELLQPEAAAPAEELRQGRTLVAATATDPVVVEAFEDPQCVHCGSFTERVEPLLVAGPVADGTASFTYNDFIVFGDESLDAAVAMRVAEEMDGKFWDYHQILFHNQAGVEDGSFSRDRLADMAEAIGLDRDEFLSGLDDPGLVAAVVAERERGAELGISSTPSLVINGQLTAGVPNWDDLSAAIEAAAAGE
jgi:protein-disulfide isomerase